MTMDRKIKIAKVEAYSKIAAVIEANNKNIGMLKKGTKIK